MLFCALILPPYISTQELALTTGPRPVFGDNDRLSALVATKLEADLLILFTDVAGLHDQDPRTHPEAAIIRRVDHPGEVGEIPLPTGITAGRGGMRSKVEAAAMAARGGCHVVITSGREPEKWPSVFAGQETGTWFPARARPHARQRWIAFAAASRGVLTLDPGAAGGASPTGPFRWTEARGGDRCPGCRPGIPGRICGRIYGPDRHPRRKRSPAPEARGTFSPFNQIPALDYIPVPDTGTSTRAFSHSMTM